MASVAGAAVVVGVDGSARSMVAVEVAVAEAALRHRPLRIVHALSWPKLPVPLPPGLTETAPGLRQQARGYLSEAAGIAGRVAPEVAVRTSLVTGRPATVLREESRRADLMVIGERGMSGLLLGSVAMELTSQAPCPLLVVRGEPRPTGAVVVGVDGSAQSMRALDFALEEASLRGTPLVALHAWAGTDSTELDRDVAAKREQWSGAAQEQRVLAETLAGAGDRYPDVLLRRQVVRGNAGSLLTDWSHTAQLVVVGDRGRGGLARLVLGSVSRHLIFHADCPTAVVRGTDPITDAGETARTEGHRRGAGSAPADSASTPAFRL
ncbi:universal stress protein [Actinoplanes sp. NPDC048967]|uniref:universal stress protein n=1 Tax=Actinoplanes sp. NPDC048967 TaxID=3155269 RepID=UPI00340D3A50